MKRWFRMAPNSAILIVLILSISSTMQMVVQSIDNDTLPGASSEDDTQGFELIKSVPYFRTAIPKRIYECISAHSIMRCMKIYVLQKMEEHKQHQRTGNLTRDFLDQFFGEEDNMASLNSERYTKLTDAELSKRLVFNFQQFFKHRDIKLHFLPGIMVRIVPSKDNRLKFSFKKKLKSSHSAVSGRAQKTDSEIDEDLTIDANVGETAAVGTNVFPASGELKNPAVALIKKRRKNKKETYSYKNAILQMGVPVMVMPAILLGSILPFVLPVLKMATIMTLLLNHSAFLAALVYAARTHANAQEEQHISYASHPVYH